MRLPSNPSVYQRKIVQICIFVYLSQHDTAEQTFSFTLFYPPRVVMHKNIRLPATTIYVYTEYLKFKCVNYKSICLHCSHSYSVFNFTVCSPITRSFLFIQNTFLHDCFKKYQRKKVFHRKTHYFVFIQHYLFSNYTKNFTSTIFTKQFTYQAARLLHCSILERTFTDKSEPMEN